MAKVKIAYAVGSDECFEPDEIDNPKSYARMTEYALVDEHDTPLAAVRRKGAPHFRRLGKPDEIRIIPKAPRSKRHTETIQDILKALRIVGRDLKITTYVWEDGAEEKSKQTLFFYRAGTAFDWFTEHPIQFEDLTRIQPDLSGRYAAHLAPLARCPAVIIEVVDTHFPEIETFTRLMALSRAGYQVYFFILGKFPLAHAQRLNKFTLKTEEPFELRITWALLKGELVKNGEAQDLEGDDADSRSRFALARLERHASQSR